MRRGGTGSRAASMGSYTFGVHHPPPSPTVLRRPALSCPDVHALLVWTRTTSVQLPASSLHGRWEIPAGMRRGSPCAVTGHPQHVRLWAVAPQCGVPTTIADSRATLRRWDRPPLPASVAGPADRCISSRPRRGWVGLGLCRLGFGFGVKFEFRCGRRCAVVVARSWSRPDARASDSQDGKRGSWGSITAPARYGAVSWQVAGLFPGGHPDLRRGWLTVTQT
ncbi:hypothetical protein C2E23DRAFT_377036 [Lenzites betulinus]|nr:hypothetical protein C2E23DRAFT_377036 [Lenzites betulinus]